LFSFVSKIFARFLELGACLFTRAGYSEISPGLNINSETGISG